MDSSEVVKAFRGRHGRTTVPCRRPFDIVRLLLSTAEDDVELLKMSPFTTLLNDNERDEGTRRSKLRRAGAR